MNTISTPLQPPPTPYLQRPPPLPPPHLPSDSACVSSSCGAGGRHFSVFINVPRPINAVAWRPEPVICCLPPSRLSAVAPRHPSHHLHRDQNALIQFMQSLLFLNSHFVCSDEGPDCPLGWPSHVRDGGGEGGTLWEQELTDLAWKASVIFLFIICCPFFLVVLCRFAVYCTTDFEAIKMKPPKSVGIHTYCIQDFCCSQSQTLARLRGEGVVTDLNTLLPLK